MSTPEAPRSGGSHRATPPPGGPPAGAPPLLLPLLSALVVLGAIGLAAWMLITAGNDGEETGNPPTVTQPATSATPEPSDTGDGNKQDGDKQNGDKGDGNKQNGDGNGKKNDGDKQNGDGKRNGGGDGNGNGQTNVTGPVPQIPVYVFNQTPITGLAAETAAQLEGQGWNVVGVDNWIGTVPEDTVYFYPGDRAAADRLAQQFPGIGRVWPASAPMPQGALTVILAELDRK